MSYFKESHSVKKIMKNDVVSSSTSSGTNLAGSQETMLGSMATNYSDETICNTADVLVLKNLVKGFFVFQGGCRLTVFNSNYGTVRVYPHITGSVTATIKSMSLSVSSIRDNSVLTIEAYSSLGTGFLEKISLGQSIITYGGAVANKASGTPELWILPIGENQ